MGEYEDRDNERGKVGPSYGDRQGALIEKAQAKTPLFRKLAEAGVVHLARRTQSSRFSTPLRDLVILPIFLWAVGLSKAYPTCVIGAQVAFRKAALRLLFALAAPWLVMIWHALVGSIGLFRFCFAP